MRLPGIVVAIRTTGGGRDAWTGISSSPPPTPNISIFSGWHAHAVCESLERALVAGPWAIAGCSCSGRSRLLLTRQPGPAAARSDLAYALQEERLASGNKKELSRPAQSREISFGTDSHGYDRLPGIVVK